MTKYINPAFKPKKKEVDIALAKTIKARHKQPEHPEIKSVSFIDKRLIAKMIIEKYG